MLPASSSEFNPIEKMWSYVKQIWRKRVVAASSPSLENKVKVDRAWMIKEVGDICNSVPDKVITNIAKSHWRTCDTFINNLAPSSPV